MKVRELIAALMEQDPDAEVILYNNLDESGSWAHGVLASERGDMTDRPTARHIWPDDGMDKNNPRWDYVSKKIVIIK